MPRVTKVETMPCPENGCKGALVKRHNKEGKPYWSCTNDECKATHGAHADGTPLGVPGDGYTRFVRKVTHDAFDRLWKTAPEHRRQDARHIAYAWLAERLGMAKDEAHIGRFDVETCDRVIELVGSKAWPYLRRWIARKDRSRRRKHRRMFSHVASNDAGFDKRQSGR